MANTIGRFDFRVLGAKGASVSPSIEIILSTWKSADRAISLSPDLNTGREIDDYIRDLKDNLDEVGKRAKGALGDHNRAGGDDTKPVCGGCQRRVRRVPAGPGMLGVMTELAIEATGLTKSFGDTKALTGVDLAVRQGSVLAVLGPNGAGKTTAVRILATLLRADAGFARDGLMTFQPAPSPSPSARVTSRLAVSTGNPISAEERARLDIVADDVVGG